MKIKTLASFVVLASALIGSAHAILILPRPKYTTIPAPTTLTISETGPKVGISVAVPASLGLACFGTAEQTVQFYPSPAAAIDLDAYAVHRTMVMTSLARNAGTLTVGSTRTGTTNCKGGYTVINP